MISPVSTASSIVATTQGHEPTAFALAGPKIMPIGNDSTSKVDCKRCTAVAEPTHPPLIEITDWRVAPFQGRCLRDNS